MTRATRRPRGAGRGAAVGLGAGGETGVAAGAGVVETTAGTVAAPANHKTSQSLIVLSPLPPRDRPTVGRNSHRKYGHATSPSQNAQFPQAPRVPELDGRIPAPRRDRSTIRQEGD